MNFGMKLPKAKDNFYENSNWSQLKEPSMNRMIIYGNLLSFLLPTSLLYICWLNFGFNLEEAKSFGKDIGGIWLVISVPILLFLHELFHAVIFPDFGLSSKTTIVFMPSKFAAFAYHSGEMTKNRYLLCLLTPLILMTFIPLLLCIYNLNYCLLWLAVLNASFSGGDLISTLIVYKNMPKNSIIKNSGYNSFYRKC